MPRRRIRRTSFILLEYHLRLNSKFFPLFFSGFSILKVCEILLLSCSEVFYNYIRSCRSNSSTSIKSFHLRLLLLLLLLLFVGPPFCLPFFTFNFRFFWRKKKRRNSNLQKTNKNFSSNSNFSVFNSTSSFLVVFFFLFHLLFYLFLFSFFLSFSIFPLLISSVILYSFSAIQKSLAGTSR